MRTLSDLSELQGKRVILRCDLNVPLEGNQITDDGRIRASLPTIQYLIERGAKVIIISHLGRPEGKPETEYSLNPVAKRLSELLDRPVQFCSETVGSKVTEMVGLLTSGSVLLLENLRFNPGETAKADSEREAFAREIAEFGNYFVSDGFGVVHRKQASVYELAKILPSVAGLLIEAELKVLQQLTHDQKRPYVVVLGGSKVSDKLGVIENLLPQVDSLLIGGGMLFTFLAAQGYKIGSSLLEEDQINQVKSYIAKAKELGVEIILPTDIVMAETFSAAAKSTIAPKDNLEGTAFGAKGIGLDIGPNTAEEFSKVISSAKTVFWNGPMGVYEFDQFAKGTKAIAQALTMVQGTSVVGGGDSAAAVRALGFRDDQFTHISTGGGASLEYLEGKEMPGLEVLE
ncbi:MAG: phosphoglycerate kinase [Actinomycetota bacterium]|jgi:phosphoglycerate kinase